MARNESDKEDLIADATALINRAEFEMNGPNSTLPILVTAGVRKDDSLSLYFDQDPFYQFDAENRLRRSYENGYLYRSEGNTLARLKRTRTPGKTTLQRYDLTTEELESFRHRMVSLVESFRTGLQSNSIRRLRRVVEDEWFDDRLTERLSALLSTYSLSTSINRRH